MHGFGPGKTADMAAHIADFRQNHANFAHKAFGFTLSQIFLQGGADFRLTGAHGPVQPVKGIQPEGNRQRCPGTEEVPLAL